MRRKSSSDENEKPIAVSQKSHRIVDVLMIKWLKTPAQQLVLRIPTEFALLILERILE